MRWFFYTYDFFNQTVLHVFPCHSQHKKILYRLLEILNFKIKKKSLIFF